jgi:hypothetical protein
MRPCRQSGSVLSQRRPACRAVQAG